MNLPLKPWKRRALYTALALGSLSATGEITLRLTPLPQALEHAPRLSTEFVDRDGRPLREILADDRRYASRVELPDVSPHLVNATISAEDRRFYEHPGVDPFAVCRAVWQLAIGQPPASGASTITMQLVKIAEADADFAKPSSDAVGYPSAPRRTVWRKLSETWAALRVERSWSKERILTEYLNRLDYGNLQVGIASASRYYLGKPASDLSAREAAFLAALPKAPSRLNPHLHRAEADQRARWVLGRMRATGRMTTDAEFAETPLTLRSPARDFAAPHFVDLLLTRRGTIPERGGTVRTTLDLPLNRFAERTLAETLRGLDGKHATAGAAVVLDNATGEVLALACTSTAESPGAADVNTAWMIRSPGSALKPFTYLLALQQGHHPCTVVPDVATDFATPTGSYRPNNYNHRFYGPVSLRFSLGNSLNVGAIRALELAGGPETLQHALRLTGITTLDHPVDYYGLGLTLGNGEVRLLELANAYATLARLGRYEPYRLLRRESPPGLPSQRVFQEGAAWLLADMLSDNSARASSFGLDSYLAFDFPVACKTGTSSDYRDNWCLGYTPEFTVGVWVGNADGSRMHGITGVTGAAPVLHEIFEHLHKTRGTTWYSPRAEITSYPVDPLTGHRVAAGAPGAVVEKCLRTPALATSADYDAYGRVLLPPLYRDWLAGPQNLLGSLVTTAASGAELQILEPPAGSVFFLDPDLPADSQYIPLRTATAADLKWTSSTLPVAASPAGPRAQLVLGRHELQVRDSATGQEARTWIEVRPL